MRNAIAVGCFVLSGAAGLVYEVCWIRRATLVFGSTTYALSTVLAVFFLGLAAGSYFFGRISPGLGRPLRVYALMEVGLAALALASLPGFELAEVLYGHAYRASAAPALLGLERFALVSLVLLPPTFLMGGTLPLFCRQFVHSGSRVAAPVGLLYGANTLGAAAGCAAAGLYLIPRLGLSRTVLLAAGLNVVSGALVAWTRARAAETRVDAGARPRATEAPLDRNARTRAAETRAVPQARPLPAAPHRAVAMAALVFLAGFVALGNEVLWTRFLALLVRNTVYTYVLTLTVVLVGIVLGSLLAALLFDRRLPRAQVFGALQVLVGIAVVGLMLLPAPVWERLGEGLGTYFVLLLPPAVLSGASFPLAVRMVVEDPSLAGVGVGRTAAINTLGGIAGSLAVGFGALPLLGLEASVLLVTGASLACGVAAWFLLERPGAGRLRGLAAGAGALVWLAIPWASGTRIPARYLSQGGELVAYREGLQSNLAVVRREGILNLEIDRLWQGQDRKGHQIVAAHLPMLIHPNPRRVLVVGVGAGQTPERFLMYDVRRLDCVDIEPAVFDLVRSHFGAEWMKDPRVGLIRGDGRNYLTHTANRYDVISLEVGQTFRPGVASFYTADFYSRARARLEPGGLLSQFVPMRFLAPEAFRGVIATFRAVFPRSVLWYNTSELLLIGVNGDRLRLDPGRLGLLASDRRIHDDLRYAYWGGSAYWLNQPRVLLAGFLCGTNGLADLSAGAAIYRDDRPVLDYAVTRLDESQDSEIPSLALLRPHLEPVAAVAGAELPADSGRAIAEVRDKNLRDIETRVALRHVAAARATGGHAAVGILLVAALRANPEDAEAHRVLGDALLHLGRLEEARAHFETVLAMRPDEPLAHRGLAFALHRMGLTAEAIPHYQAALALGGDDGEVHNNLGAALGQRGDLRGALPHFERAVRLRPDLVDARENLERALTGLRDSLRR